MISLPVDHLIPKVIKEWPSIQNFLISASPGSGKTTRLPAALLTVLSDDKEVWVLVPRRLAALLAAKRVADERGWELGGEVGYHFRFDHCAGSKTRLLFLTEGIFLKRLQSDPSLKNVGCLILDEFHERHIDTDMAISLARALQKGLRPDLKIGVMSATIDSLPLKNFLAPLTDFDLKAPPHPLEIRYQAAPARLEEGVKQTVMERLQADSSGHILVFLPGIGAIEKCRQVLAHLGNSSSVEIICLHGELSPAEQTAFLNPSSKRKVILATNIAESSVTLDGVSIVIDSGLHRRTSYSWWSGIPSLVTRPISKASAIQRAGRANRQGPGKVVRMYPEHDYLMRPDFEVPEIKRADLTGPLLQLAAQDVWGHQKSGGHFQWFDEPPSTAIDHAEQVLSQLGAFEKSKEGYALTNTGRQMGESSLNPRLARVMQEAAEKGITAEMAIFVTHLALKSSESGFLFDSKPMRQKPLWLRQYKLLSREALPVSIAPEKFDIMAACLLTGFSDFVGQVKKEKATSGNTQKKEIDIKMCQGGRVLLDGGQSVVAGDLIIALDVQETKQGSHQKIHIKSYIHLNEESLMSHGDWLSEQSDYLWNAKLKRVDELYQVCYGQIVLEEEQTKATPGPKVLELLFKEGFGISWPAEANWSALKIIALKLDESFESKILPLLARLFWLEQLKYQADLATDFLRAFQNLVEEVVGFDGLKDKMDSLEFYLSPEIQKLLSAHVPSTISLPGKLKVAVHYEFEKSPWIESRMQDFFGLTQTPTIASGQLVLTCHLLAPNYRAVQVTTDLNGFWLRVYPEIKGQLQRRYPRHKWI